MDLELELGAERVVVKSDTITVKTARLLRSNIKAVRDIYNKELDQQNEAVQKVLEKYKETLTKKDDESIEEFNKRVEPVLVERKAEVDLLIPEDKESFIMDIAYRCIKAIAEQFGQAHKVTPTNFDQANWPKIKKGLAKFLISNECELGQLFLPPKEIS